MEDALINLLGRFPVQGAQDVVGPVGVRGDEPVIAQLVVNVLLIGLDASAVVAHQGVSHRVLINPAVGRHLSSVAGASHKGDFPAV